MVRAAKLVLTQYTPVTPTSPDDITIVTNVRIDPAWAWVYIWTEAFCIIIHPSINK